MHQKPQTMSTTPTTMNAWRMSAAKKPSIFRSRIPIPSPGPKRVLVKLHAMGVCHSDCGIRDMSEHPPTWSDEFTLGHEGAGEIVALGDETTSSLAIGDLVAIHPLMGCKSEQCMHCSHGWSHACQAAETAIMGLAKTASLPSMLFVEKTLLFSSQKE